MLKNAEQLKKHIKKNGITLVKITEDFMPIPKGTKLWVGIDNRQDGDMLSTWNDDSDNHNREFDYDFDYEWSESWDKRYHGLFELIEENLIIHCPTKEDYKKIVDKIGWSIDIEDKRGRYWNKYKGKTSIDIKNGKIYGYSNIDWCRISEPYKHHRFITAKAFLGEEENTTTFSEINEQPVLSQENLDAAKKALEKNISFRYTNYWFTNPRLKYMIDYYKKLNKKGNKTMVGAECYGSCGDGSVDRTAISPLQKLSKTLKRVLNKDMRYQYKAGYRDGDLNLTPRGCEALRHILSIQFEKELSEEAREYINEVEKKK